MMAVVLVHRGAAANKRDNQNDAGSSSSGLSLIRTPFFLLKSPCSVKQ